MSELLPCPFCGGTKLHVTDIATIICRQCNAEVNGAGTRNSFDTWNTRATMPTAESELVEALRNIREKASQGMSHGLTADATCEDILRFTDAALSNMGKD